MLVGADTARKIVNAKYHGGSQFRLAASLEQIRRSGCKFLVAGRLDSKSGVFETLGHVLDAMIPAQEDRAFSDALFETLEFRVDMSSTKIRNERFAGRKGET